MKTPVPLLLLAGTLLLQTARSVDDPQQPVVLTVEAYVDGDSVLHVSKEGLYWTNGNAHKPGRPGGQPTYVNGTAWTPVWGKPEADLGKDKSDVRGITLSSLNLKVELVSNAPDRALDEVDKTRSPIDVKRRGSEIQVTIPDVQGGARWYKLAFRERRSK